MSPGVQIKVGKTKAGLLRQGTAGIQAVPEAESSTVRVWAASSSSASAAA